MHGSLFPRPINTSNTELSIYEFYWALHLLTVRHQARKDGPYAAFLERIAASLYEATFHEEGGAGPPDVPAPLVKRAFRTFSQARDVMDEAIPAGFDFWHRVFLLAVKHDRDFAQVALNMCYSFFA